MSPYNIVKICCCLLLIGRGWQHFFWDIPLRAVLWDEAWMEGIVTNLLGMTWQQWASSTTLDSFINGVSKLLGAFYFLLGLFVWKIEKFPKAWWLLPLSSATLFFVFLIGFKAKFYYVGYLIEHATQFGVPLFFYWFLKDPKFNQKKMTWMKIGLVGTFVGHGLFAVGYYPVPGHFVDMLIVVFDLSNENAIDVLSLAGSIDLAASIFIWIPVLQKYALGFMTFWGTVTAFARTVAHVDFNLLTYTSHQWIPETIYRIPHGLVALAVFLMIKESEKITTNNAKR